MDIVEQEIADYEQEIERIRLNYEVTQWRPWSWSEPQRARRIRDKQRMKAKARRIFRRTDGGDMAPGWGAHSNAYSYQLWLKDCEKLADNLAHCSRRCCNRQRYWDGPPMQERRERARTDDMMRRSPHLMGPRRVDPVAEINRRLHRKIHELLRQH